MQGCLKPITVLIPPNTILSPSPTAAVVGGNVLTSQRVTDVVLKAFNAAAASQVTVSHPTRCSLWCFNLVQPVVISTQAHDMAAEERVPAGLSMQAVVLHCLVLY